MRWEYLLRKINRQLKQGSRWRDMNFDSAEEATDQWTYYGKYYGFPECCIHDFCHPRGNRDRQFQASNSTGFVPCKDHAEQILSGQVTLEELITNRKHPISFPDIGG